MEVLEKASAVKERANKLLKKRGLTFSIPPEAVLQQADMRSMLQALNESVQEKLDTIAHKQYLCLFDPFAAEHIPAVLFRGIEIKMSHLSTPKRSSSHQQKKMSIVEDLNAPCDYDATNGDSSHVLWGSLLLMMCRRNYCKYCIDKANSIFGWEYYSSLTLSYDNWSSIVHDSKILSETENDGTWSVSVYTCTRITVNGKSSREFACSAFGVDTHREVAQFKAFHVSIVLVLYW